MSVDSVMVTMAPITAEQPTSPQMTIALACHLTTITCFMPYMHGRMCNNPQVPQLLWIGDSTFC